MAGIQIDGVNNKIDFDDDLDTSISANTDDTLQVEVGGASIATMTASTVVFNEASADIDFRVESNGNSHMIFVDGGNNRVHMGAATTGNGTLNIENASNDDTLVLVSTDADANNGPVLNLYRNSSSPADNDAIGQLKFVTRNDNSQDWIASQMIFTAVDVSDGTEDAVLDWYMMNGGDSQARLTFSGTETVFNDASKDLDFRVESNAKTHMLFVDGGNDKVGINESSPACKLHLTTNDLGTLPTLQADADDFIIEGTTVGITLMGATGGGGMLAFGDTDDADIGRIFYYHVDNSMRFFANAAERMRIITNKVGFGTATPQAGIDIERDDTVIRGTNSSSTANYQNMRLFSAVGGTGTETFRIENDGDVKNTNNSYGSISDERIKQNITDAGSQWDDIKALKIRNYKRKDQVAAGLDITMIGVIAQELETAGMNGLVKESPPGTGEIRANSVFGTIEELKTYYTSTDIEVEKGTKSVGDVKQTAYKENPSDVLVKGVKYSVLYMKAIKALQEAQTRIETLETKVAALEG